MFRILVCAFIYSTCVFALNLNENSLGLENSNHLRAQIQDMFLEDGQPSEKKIESFKNENIKDREEEIKLIIDNLTTRENLTQEEALDEALKEKKIQSINYILTKLKMVQELNEPLKIEGELKNILRVYLALKREARDSNFVHGVKSIISMFFMGHDLPIEDSKREPPSNLLNASRKRFFTKTELLEKIENGEDLSQIDPPNSSFWEKPEKISQKNPVKEYEGRIPQEFKYNETVTREGNPKIEVTETSTGKKVKWRMKFGREINNEGFVSRLFNLLGFHSDEYFYIKNPKVYFKNKKEYEGMLLDWIGYFHNGLSVVPSRFIKETGEDEKGFFVIFFESLLETRPKNEIRVGDFHVTEMGNWERREVRAILLLMAFVNNPDFKPSRNNKVKLIKNGDDPDTWEIQELVHDLGFAFGGQLMSSTPNEYPWSFLKRRGKKLKIKYINNQLIPKNKNPFMQATYSDLKWLARYFVQIKREQLEKLAKTSGWPESVAILNLEKMVKRRNEIVLAFELKGKEIDGEKISLWPEVNPKTFSNGQDIKNGKLVETYKPEGFTVDYINHHFEPDQIVAIAKPLVGMVFNAIGSIPYYRMISSPHEFRGFTFSKVLPGVGLGVRLSRIVEFNKGALDDSKAWITHDTLEIFSDAAVVGYIPITTGINGKLKIEFLVGKHFRISYFSPTPLKALKGNAKLLAQLPFKRRKIIENLRSGESLADGLFFEVAAKEGIQNTELGGIGAGLEQKKIFLKYREISKGDDQLMNVSRVKSKSFDFSLNAYLELFEILKIDFFKAGIKFGDKKILTYHFNLDKNATFETKEAYQLAAFTTKDDPKLEKIPTSKAEIKYYEKYWTLGILATLGGNTSGLYNISEDAQGNISRSFDYSTVLEKKTPGFNISYRLIGRQEFSDPKFENLTNEKISLEYQSLFPQMTFKQMDKQKSIVNGLVADKTFLIYKPENHSINHLGKTFIDLRFDFKKEALECIFEKINCLAKGPGAYKIDHKLKVVREKKTPVKRLEKLGPFLRNTLLNPKSFKNFLLFVGGEKFSTELFVDSDVISQDRFIHKKKEFLTL